jgi:hypothetical protein
MGGDGFGNLARLAPRAVHYYDGVLALISFISFFSLVFYDGVPLTIVGPATVSVTSAATFCNLMLGGNAVNTGSTITSATRRRAALLWLLRFCGTHMLLGALPLPNLLHCHSAIRGEEQQ